MHWHCFVSYQQDTAVVMSAVALLIHISSTSDTVQCSFIPLSQDQSSDISTQQKDTGDMQRLNPEDTQRLSTCRVLIVAPSSGQCWTIVHLLTKVQYNALPVSFRQGFMQDKIIASHTCFGGHLDVNC